MAVTRARPYQEGFSVGELDPKMVARVGVEAYYAGARKLTNVMHLPTGAVTRRFGSKYIAQVPGPGFNLRLEPFEFNELETYLTIWTQGLLQIYRGPGAWPPGTSEDTLLQNLVAPYLNADVPAIRVTQSADTMIIVHGKYAPRRLVRDTTTFPETFRLYDLTDEGPDPLNPLVTLNNVPLFDFDDADSPATSVASQEIIFLGTWVEGVGFKFALQGIEHPQSILWDDDLDIMRDSIESELRRLPNLPDPVNLTVELDPDPAPDDRRFVVTFGGGNAGREWDAMTYRISANQGRAEDGVIDIRQVNPGDSSLEPVWSALRGWPRTATFHEDRLIFCGSPSRPATLWGSRSSDYFNFDVGDALDNDAIDVTIQNGLDAVRAVMSSRHLQVFTTGGEWYTPEVPLTPTNIAFSRQTNVGVAPNVPPVSLDGATLFVDHHGRGLRQFVFQYTEDAYRQQDISLISQHLIREPVDMHVLATVEGDYVLVVNSDGTIACLNLHRDQEIAAWTEWTTEGQFEAVTVVGHAAYALVMRGTARHLERFERDYLVDAGRKDSGADVTLWTGFNHLEGRTVDVIADGKPEPQRQVTAGAVATPFGASTIEVGLPVRPFIETMPLVVQTAEGRTQTRVRRLTKCDVLLHESGAVVVSGWPVSQRRTQSDRLQNPPPLLTGQFEVRLRGWSREPTVTITQDQPLPFTVLAIGYQMEVSQ